IRDYKVTGVQTCALPILMFLVLLGGVVAYRNLGRLEDPEFTIKEALIITPYPGASAEEVAREVTNPIETACQQLGQLKRVESDSDRKSTRLNSSHLVISY